jgi:hypothetical protein
VKPAGGWAAGEQGLHRGGRHRVPPTRCSRVEQVDGQGRPRSPTRTRRPARGQTTRRLHTGRPAGIRSPDPAGLRDQSHIDANAVVLGGGYCGTIAAAQRIEVPLYQAVSMPASAIRFWPRLRSAPKPYGGGQRFAGAVRTATSEIRVLCEQRSGAGRFDDGFNHHRQTRPSSCHGSRASIHAGENYSIVSTLADRRSA